MTESTVSEHTTHRVRKRDALAAATVWLPFFAFVVTLVMWSDSLPADVTLRNDVNSSAAAVFPMWVIAVGVGVVLIGLGLGAISVVPEGSNSAETRRVPLFWARGLDVPVLGRDGATG